MKKLSITIACMSLACASWAHDVEVDGIYYNLIEKAKEAEVTFRGASYDEFRDEYSGTVSIPSSIVVNDQEYPVTSIGERAFYECVNLKTVDLPLSITSIQKDAFQFCSDLEAVSIPNSVSTIGENAFYFCRRLSAVSIPSSVTSLQGNSFTGCEDLKSITVESDNPNYYSEDNIIYSKDKTTLVYCASSKVGKVSIPNTVTQIGKDAFHSCMKLTMVDIPTSVEIIDDYAFWCCYGLTDAPIPNSVTEIGVQAFSACTSLSSGNIPNSVTNMEMGAFAGCSNITSVSISNSLTSIAESAFGGCSKLSSVNIPSGVTFIDYAAFMGCSKLTSVSFPNSLKVISSLAFKDCTSLSSVNISSVTWLYDNVFNGCSSLTSVTLGSSISHIYSKTFANCSNLETVICLAEEVPETGLDVFENSFVGYATLNVPTSSVQAYKTTAPWSEFGTFETADGSEIPVPMVCATPIVTYENGELHFSCETEGATYHCNMQIPGQISIESTGVAKLPDSYTILVTAYATAEGYEPSEKATTTITISVCDVNGDGVVSIADVDALVNKILGRTNGSSSDPYNGHDYVDLGVVVDGKPVYWATTNIGAEQPADYGLYFAWGETEGYGSSPRGEREKDELGMVQIPILDDRLFSWSSYSSDLCDGRDNSLKKYCTDSSYGTVDNKTVLAPEDDAAHVNWQGKWRMPTKQEQEALLEQCVWTWSAMTNSSGERINGYKISNKVDSTKFIFLPAAGGRDNGYLDEEGSRGNYWSASLSVGNSGYAYGLDFYSGNWFSASHGRYGGLSIRPVCQ